MIVDVIENSECFRSRYRHVLMQGSRTLDKRDIRYVRTKFHNFFFFFGSFRFTK